MCATAGGCQRISKRQDENCVKENELFAFAGLEWRRPSGATSRNNGKRLAAAEPFQWRRLIDSRGRPRHRPPQATDERHNIAQNFICL